MAFSGKYFEIIYNLSCWKLFGEFLVFFNENSTQIMGAIFLVIFFVLLVRLEARELCRRQTMSGTAL